MTEPQTDVAGDERTTKSKVLEAGAGMTQVRMTTSKVVPNASDYKDINGAGQDFTPVKSICAHLNAFHVYADDPKRFVEANHYCSHLTEGMHLAPWYEFVTMRVVTHSPPLPRRPPVHPLRQPQPRSPPHRHRVHDHPEAVHHARRRGAQALA